MDDAVDAAHPAGPTPRAAPLHANGSAARVSTAAAANKNDHPALDADTIGDLPAAGGPLGAALEPTLRRACDGRLSGVTWFRTDWQRGGAATGYAGFDADGDPHAVVVKLPVPPRERRWLVRLQAAGGVVPRVYAHGESLNGYDLAWVVMERLPHGPLGSSWGGVEFDLAVDAIGRFYRAAADVPVTGEPSRRDWPALVERARRQVAAGAVPEPQRWKNALKKTAKGLDAWVAQWESRPIDGWRHGDLHLANTMTRTPPPEGPAVLLDFAEVEPGHWLEDAVYFEHLFWASNGRLGGRKLTKAIAHRRKELGLPVDADWSELARVQRALLAATTPAMLDAEGESAHVTAALTVLERETK